jgi:hypothetical protein
MPKYPEFKSKPIIGLKENELDKVTVGYLNKLDGQYARTNYLRFKPELILELSKGFTSTTQMIKYKGENEEQINAAGRYIDHGVIERPEWLEDINFQTPEECLEEARSYNNVTYEELPWYLRQKLVRHFEPAELRKLLSNIDWKKIYRTDDDFVKLLSQFKTAAEMRNTSREYKNILSRIIGDEGVNYPKAYALAESMKTGKTGSKPGRREAYGQRTSLVEQYTLNKELLGKFTWAQIKEMGFKRPTIVGALTRKDANHKAKGYLWKYEIKDWGEGLK